MLKHLFARNDACFCPFCLNLLTFFTLQDKHNIRTLSLNIKFICTRCETGLKSSPKARYSAVSKARTNKFYIYRQCTYIVYVCFRIMGYWCFSSFSRNFSAFSLLPYEIGRKVQIDIMYWKDEPMSLVFALSLEQCILQTQFELQK